METICQKCFEKKANVFGTNKRSYCKICFENSIIKSFKKEIPKQLYARMDKVLIVTDGSIPSQSLIYLLMKSKFESYIISEKAFVYNIIGFHYISSLPFCSADSIQFVKINLENLCDELMSLYKKAYLKDILNKILSFSKKFTFKEKLFNSSLEEYAIINCINKIILCDTLTSVSEKILYYSCIGIGHSIPLLISNTINHHNKDMNVSILRPLEKIPLKELTLILYFNDIPFHLQHDLMPINTIQNILKDYLFKTSNDTIQLSGIHGIMKKFE